MNDVSEREGSGADAPVSVSPAGHTILVTGATGRQGEAVARRLMAKGWPVRIMTRDPDQKIAMELAALGAEVAVGDLTDRESLHRAVRGVYGVYSVQNYWMHGFDEEVRQGKRLADVARAEDVGHFVYSSAGGVSRTDGLGITHLDSKFVIERHIEAIGLPYTVFRPVTFFENFITPRFIKRIFRKGMLYTPIRDGIDFQMVALEDVGSFVEIAFANRDRFLYTEREIASDAFTMSAFAAEIGKVIGKPLIHRQMSPAVLKLVTEIVERTRTTGHFGIGRPTYAQLRWNNSGAAGGWAARIGELRRFHPGLLTMPEWVASIDWQGLRKGR